MIQQSGELLEIKISSIHVQVSNWTRPKLQPSYFLQLNLWQIIALRHIIGPNHTNFDVYRQKRKMLYQQPKIVIEYLLFA